MNLSLFVRRSASRICWALSGFRELVCPRVVRPFAIALTSIVFWGGSSVESHAQSRAKQTADFSSLLAQELRSYAMVYEVDFSNPKGGDINYTVDQANAFVQKYPGGFSRVAYRLTLEKAGGPKKACYASMTSFTDDLAKLRIPTAENKIVFQTEVQDLTVLSNVEGVKNGTFTVGGNIEIWPYDYNHRNAKQIPNASTETYDFGDEYNTKKIYGSLQIHNFGTKQTLIGINNWKKKPMDIGIGSSLGLHPDWTFAKNGGDYLIKQLQIYVLPRSGPQAPAPVKLPTRVWTANNKKVEATFLALVGSNVNMLKNGKMVRPFQLNQLSAADQAEIKAWSAPFASQKMRMWKTTSGTKQLKLANRIGEYLVLIDPQAMVKVIHLDTFSPADRAYIATTPLSSPPLTTTIQATDTDTSRQTAPTSPAPALAASAPRTSTAPAPNTQAPPRDLIVIQPQIINTQNSDGKAASRLADGSGLQKALRTGDATPKTWPAHQHTDKSDWTSPRGTIRDQHINIDLGKSYTLAQLVLWQSADPNGFHSGLKRVAIYGSEKPDLADQDTVRKTWRKLGEFELSRSTIDQSEATVLRLENESGIRTVYLDILENFRSHGQFDVVSLGEIRFTAASK